MTEWTSDRHRDVIDRTAAHDPPPDRMTLPPSQLPPAPRRAARRAVVALVAAATVGALVGPGVAAAPAAESRVGPAAAALDGARADRRTAEAALAAAAAARRAVEAEAAELGRREAELTAELARVRAQVREYAVAAYIDGGRTELYLASLAPDDAGALAWRTGLVAGSTVSQGRSVDRYQALRDESEPQRIAAATRLDRARDAEDRARSAFLQAAALERDAEAELDAARAEAAREAAERAAAEREAARVAAERARAEQVARQRAARPAPARAPDAPRAPRPPAAAPTGGQIGDATASELALLARIRQCESGGNYSIVSASGRYRGAYQFSVATWQAMGGTGDPAAASPAEQDQRALMLLRRQGPRAWPVCSR